jgi:hypothetical protein
VSAVASMPQPRKYTNRAQQQAAYRKRCASALRTQMQAKGLPALPPTPAMPGTARWRAAVRMAQELLTSVCDEMQVYADDRSEEWQESERAEELNERQSGIEHIRDALDEYC